MRAFLILALLLTGCPRGGIDESCRRDGSCDAPGLTCQMVGINLMTGSRAFRCLPPGTTP